MAARFICRKGRLVSMSLAPPRFHSTAPPHVDEVKFNAGRAIRVNTLDLVRKLEAGGWPTKHAEAIVLVITESLKESMEDVIPSLVPKGEIQKGEIIRDMELSKFDFEVMGSTAERKKLRSEIDKMHADSRNKIFEAYNKLGLEQKEVYSALHQEIHALNAGMEAAKYEVAKYCLGALVLFCTVGGVVLRLTL